MTSWTAPSTWVDTNALTAAQLNQQARDNLLNADERLALHGILSATRLNQVKGALAGVRATASASQGINTTTTTAVTWDTEAYDSDGFHSTASNTNRITIPAGMGGIYLVCAVVEWVDPQTAVTAVAIRDDDGSTQHARTRTQWDGPSGANRYQTLMTPVTLAAGDWIEVVVEQTLGITVDLNKHSAGCGFAAWRLFAS